MGTAVTMGAMLSCSFGQAPASLVVIRPTLMAGSMPAANIMDAKPMANIPTFAMCTTPQSHGRSCNSRGDGSTDARTLHSGDSRFDPNQTDRPRG